MKISHFLCYCTDHCLVRYVALLAFNKIVVSHPHVVAKHQDIIMSCIEDPDVSIRLQALDLGSGMVNAENLVSVVDGLMQQLRDAPYQAVQDSVKESRPSGPEPAADSEGEDPEETLRVYKPATKDNPPMLDEYRITIIRHVLGMCCRDTYAYITDFEWYISVLIDLVRLVPPSSRGKEIETVVHFTSSLQYQGDNQISSAIGSELRNVAVRVSAVRTDAVRAAVSLVMAQCGQNTNLVLSPSGQEVLQYAAWIIGEYAQFISNKHDALNSLLLPTLSTLSVGIICAYLQAIPKILVEIFRSYEHSWASQTKTMTSLLLARFIHLLEPCTTHPNLEVQERSVEFLELMRLAAEAVHRHEPENENGPLLFRRAIPSLFNGSVVNPVAATAQHKVPFPANLDLDIPLNKTLTSLLVRVDQVVPSDGEQFDMINFYNQKPHQDNGEGPAVNKLVTYINDLSSYQYEETSFSDPGVSKRRHTERREKNKDDPFYIASGEISSEATTPFHEIIQNSNGPDMDIDSIPIMNLELGDQLAGAGPSNVERTVKKGKQRPKIHVMSDENIEDDFKTSQRAATGSTLGSQGSIHNPRGKIKKSLLEVDSSGLGGFGIDEYSGTFSVEQPSFIPKDLEEAEMAKALAEVERLRLEMQRKSERIQIAEDVPLDGTLIKKKRKKKERSIVAKREGSDREITAEGVHPTAIVKKNNKKKKGATMSETQSPAA